MTLEERECRIASSYLELCTATDPKIRKAAADFMMAEIRARNACRTPGQIAEIERQKGLR